ncbi:MAG: glycosyltransferase family 4 protein, partial [Gammaproteobacteria bacterium]|nr:glycosyltransferase family 4 protein [Gammaproteobacteria bacterium]
ILQVIESAGAGSGRHVLELCAGLLHRNHDVSLVYSPERADGSFVAQIGGLNGLSLHELPMQRAVGPADFKHARVLRALIRETGPFDVLHGHSSKGGALLRLAALGLNTPCVYTPHALITLDPDLIWPARLVYGGVERFLARYTARIICVSDQERDHGLALGLPQDKLAVVPNGIDSQSPADRHTVRQELGLHDDQVCVGAVGRLSHQKAIDRLVTAFAMIASGCPRARLLIVGDGPQRTMLEDLIISLGVSKQVRLIGPGDGARLMAAFDIFALSSRYESCPYVLLEAAARELPIVMTDTGGAGSLVREKNNGYIVPQADAETFAARLRKLIHSPILRRSMAQNSKLIAQRYNLDQMIEKTLAVYHDSVPD